MTRASLVPKHSLGNLNQYRLGNEAAAGCGGLAELDNLHADDRSSQRTTEQQGRDERR